MVAAIDESLLIRERSEITDDWLSRVLDTPGLRIEEVRGIGAGAMALTLRVTYAGSRSGTTIVKLASEDESTRNVGLMMGAYRQEVRFYEHIREHIAGPLPTAHFSAFDPVEGWFTLVMEDVVDVVAGDQAVGATVEQAAEVMRMLAAVHAPVVGRDDLAELPPFAGAPENFMSTDLLSGCVTTFSERFGHRLDTEHIDVLERYALAADAYNADRRAPFGVVHADARLDNVLFGGHHGAVLVDWQTVQWGSVMTDVAYFLGSSLPVETRRAEEERLVRTYHEALVAHGVADFGWDEAWEGYRRQVFWGIAMPLVSAVFVENSERIQEVFVEWTISACQQAIDLGSLEFLPEVEERTALRVDPVDEGAHDTEPPKLWSESYYADAVSDDQRIGVYARIGDTRNLGRSLVSLAIVRPGQAPVILSDAEAPLPEWADDGVRLGVRAPSYTLEIDIAEPIERFTVAFEGEATTYADDVAILRGEAGVATQVSLRLTWERDGIDYRWRRATRYEIPCRVTGTITIDGEEFDFAGDGQRDHSWGIRDWWGNAWMWSAFRLDDGTKVHAVTVEETPGLAFGYVQKGDRIAELSAGGSTIEVGETGRLTKAIVKVDAEDLVVKVRPQAYGSLLLTADDGRVAHFIRALATFSTTDGREGVGWIEWEHLVDGPRGGLGL
ncbi:phosphotransferase [Agromyces rhizosphaerae]|uniref:Phosphotransferase n=1 Tax=Agromyces rhizosphaerae TaxID=88374 RepID=A0A9W6CZP9_9MICO|nr:phosphotransferase [Agromyces rhizosphaerae]GLI28580.1 phosphotransferase [Agromyces rhizosphaerae]